MKQDQQIVKTKETAELTAHEIKIKVDTDEAQGTHLDMCMKPPNTTMEKEESHLSCVQTNENIVVDIDHETMQVNNENTSDRNQKMTPP